MYTHECLLVCVHIKIESCEEGNVALTSAKRKSNRRKYLSEGVSVTLRHQPEAGEWRQLRAAAVEERKDCWSSI